MTDTKTLMLLGVMESLQHHMLNVAKTMQKRAGTEPALIAYSWELIDTATTIERWIDEIRENNE